MAIVGGKNVARQIAEALGLGGRAVRRVVIDVSVNDVVKFYVEECAQAPAFDPDSLAQALASARCEEVADEPVVAPAKLGGRK